MRGNRFAAACKGRRTLFFTEAMHLLLAAGAAVNAKDKRGWTPLHWAAARGKAEAFRLLLAAGAKVDEPDANGETPSDLTKTDECRKLPRQAGGKTGAELDAEKQTSPK